MIKKFRKELNAGTVSLVILAVLKQSEKPLYGYQIAKLLEQLGEPGEPAVKQGTLYPVLRSMEKNELLTSQVEPSVSGPPRKYYTITTGGIEVLKEWTTVWRSTRDFVEAILDGQLKIGDERGGKQW